MCMSSPKIPPPPVLAPPPIPAPPPAKPATLLTPKATGVQGDALRRQGKKGMLINTKGAGTNTPGY